MTKYEKDFYHDFYHFVPFGHGQICVVDFLHRDVDVAIKDIEEILSIDLSKIKFHKHKIYFCQTT